MLDKIKHRVILFNLIKEIYSSKAGMYLGFKGGTMAYFFYGLDRFSVDLDFDLLNQEKIKVVEEELELIFKKYASIVDKKDKRFTLFYLLSYEKGQRRIKVEISKRNVVANYEINNFYGVDVFVQRIEDAFATKLLACLTRSNIAYRDFYDVLFFLKKGVNPNQKIIRSVYKKDLKALLIDLKKVIEKRVTNRKVVEAVGELVDEEKKDFVRKKFKQELISHLEFYLAQVNNIIR